MKKKDHYLKIVEWSEEDQCYVGSIPGWIGKCCHGDNEEDVYRQLCQILDEWIEIYENDNIPLPPGISGKKFSGKFQLRVDSDLHKALAIRAMQANESLNSFCSKILRKTILQKDHLKANNCVERD
jgi:predicted HicB family RNase H-like nuclease